MTADRPAQRLEWIDALRGIAALDVALFHGALRLWAGFTAFSVATIGGTGGRLDEILSLPARFGYAGVMLFFLLSGFCIHHPAARLERLDLRRFAIRRIFRIYPPYLVATLLAVVVGLIAASAVAHTYPHPVLVAKTVALVQNYPHYGGAVADLARLQLGANYALWSLPVEFELYLAYPLVFWLWRTRGAWPAIGLVVAASAVATAVQIFVEPVRGAAPNAASYVPTFLHYWLIWCAGAWLAEMNARSLVPAWRNVYAVIGAACGVLAIVAHERHLPRGIIEYAWAGFFFVVMQYCLTHEIAPRGIAAAALSGLAKIGESSYALYLIHMPVFTLLAAWWLSYHKTLPGAYPVSVAAVVLATLLAVPFYHLVERPSIALARRLSATRPPRSRPASIRDAVPSAD
jgi:peptidoglycan/LPS O-acetylase OafA/YrhL